MLNYWLTRVFFLAQNAYRNHFVRRFHLTLSLRPWKKCSIKKVFVKVLISHCSVFTGKNMLNVIVPCWKIEQNEEEKVPVPGLHRKGGRIGYFREPDQYWLQPFEDEIFEVAPKKCGEIGRANLKSLKSQWFVIENKYSKINCLPLVFWLLVWIKRPFLGFTLYRVFHWESLNSKQWMANRWWT